MFLKERWHRFGWEDLREVENALVDGVGTQSRDLSSEKFVGNDVLFRQVSPASIHCFFFLEAYMSPINTDIASQGPARQCGASSTS